MKIPMYLALETILVLSFIVLLAYGVLADTSRTPLPTVVVSFLITEVAVSHRTVPFGGRKQCFSASCADLANSKFTRSELPFWKPGRSGVAGRP